MSSEVNVSVAYRFDHVTEVNNEIMNETSDDYEVTVVNRPIWWLAFLCVIYGILIVLAVVGNIFVMIAYQNDIRIKRSVANTFILNLAIADFIVGVFTWPIYFSWLIIGPWTFGEYLCKVWSAIDYTVTAMSVITIILISLDRYWLLTKTTAYVTYQTQIRANVTIASCWGIVSCIYIILTFGFAYFTNYFPVDFSNYCDMEFIYTLPALITTIIINFVVPAIIIVVLNTMVYYKIRERAKGLSELNNKIKRESEGKEKRIQARLRLGLFKRWRGYPPHTDEVSRNLDPGVILVAVSALNSPEYHQNPAFEQQHEVTPPSSGETSGIGSVNEHDKCKNSQMKEEKPCPDSEEVGADETNEQGVYIISKSTEQEPGNYPSSRIDFLRKLFKRKQREFKRERRAAFILAVLVSVFILCWLPFQITVVVGFFCNFECVPEMAYIVAENLVWANSALNPILYAATNIHFRRNFLRLLGFKKLARKLEGKTSIA
ncbi:histamine H3 receptor-like [Diadema antillarum]|uniref:histamine H3 receptor-like n=1 Tax=Diadema antillarum TaxID=105358 RepID=UPI003A84D579